VDPWSLWDRGKHAGWQYCEGCFHITSQQHQWTLALLKQLSVITVLANGVGWPSQQYHMPPMWTEVKKRTLHLYKGLCFHASVQDIHQSCHGTATESMRNQDQPEPATCQQCGQAEETLVHLMTECPVLEDARSHHFDEDDPINFLFSESEVALSYLRDAGLTEAGCIWSLIERQKKTRTTTTTIVHSCEWEIWVEHTAKTRNCTLLPPPSEYKRWVGWTCHCSNSAFCQITLVFVLVSSVMLYRWYVWTSSGFPYQSCCFIHRTLAYRRWGLQKLSFILSHKLHQVRWAILSQRSYAVCETMRDFIFWIYGTSTSNSVPVSVSAFAGTHCAYS